MAAQGFVAHGRAQQHGRVARTRTFRCVEKTEEPPRGRAEHQGGQAVNFQWPGGARTDVVRRVRCAARQAQCQGADRVVAVLEGLQAQLLDAVGRGEGDGLGDRRDADVEAVGGQVQPDADRLEAGFLAGPADEEGAIALRRRAGRRRSLLGEEK